MRRTRRPHPAVLQIMLTSHRPYVGLLMVASAGIAGLFANAEWLMLWFTLPIIVTLAAWFRTGRLSTTRSSVETSQISDFCWSGLFSTGAALLVLVLTLTSSTELVRSGSMSSLEIGTWTSSPELLRGLVAIGAVMLATGLTLAVLFHSRETSRRERVVGRYKRRRRSLSDRLRDAVYLARSIRVGTSRSRFPYTPLSDLPFKQRGRALQILQAFEPSHGLRLDALTRLGADLASIGALSLETDHPIDLREHVKLARGGDPALEPLRRNLMWLRDAIRTIDPHSLQSAMWDEGSDAALVAEIFDEPFDPVRLLTEEDDLNAIQEAFGALDEERFASASLAELISQQWLGEELRNAAEYRTRWRTGPGRIYRRSPRHGSRVTVRFGSELHFWAGAACLTIAPAAFALLAATGMHPLRIDARWLDTILSVCAIVGAALLTLYAVLREASIDSIEGIVESALEAAGRITVLSRALLRALDHRMVTFVTQHYFSESARGQGSTGDELFASVEDEIFMDDRSNPDTFEASVKKLLEWTEQPGREPTRCEDVYFLPRSRSQAAKPGTSTRLRSARLLRYELPLDHWQSERFSGLRARYFYAAVPDFKVGDDGQLDPRSNIAVSNPPKALYLLLVRNGSRTPDSFLTLAYEPSEPLTDDPWGRGPDLRPALLGVRTANRLRATAGAITVPSDEDDAPQGRRRVRVRRLTDALWREAEHHQLEGLRSILIGIDGPSVVIERLKDALQPKPGQAETTGLSEILEENNESLAADAIDPALPDPRDRLALLCDALERFQDRNVSPLEQFTRFNGVITSEADVLEFVLAASEPPI